MFIYNGTVKDLDLGKKPRPKAIRIEPEVGLTESPGARALK